MCSATHHCKPTQRLPLLLTIQRTTATQRLPLLLPIRSPHPMLPNIVRVGGPGVPRRPPAPQYTMAEPPQPVYTVHTASPSAAVHLPWIGCIVTKRLHASGAFRQKLTRCDTRGGNPLCTFHLAWVVSIVAKRLAGNNGFPPKFIRHDTPR